MYAYDFEPSEQSINNKEIFVAMPFDPEYDWIFKDLIKPSVVRANKKLPSKSYFKGIKAYLSKDDPLTVSGWINILEHMFSAQIVLGVLTDDNANVFYELGIAHATQSISRQILIANKGYKPTFDLKDLIYMEYEDKEKVKSSIDPLAVKILSALNHFDITKEKRVHQVKMKIGLSGLSVVLAQAHTSHFVIQINDRTKLEYENIYGKGSFETFLKGIDILCQLELLGLNTKPLPNRNIEYSLWWTRLGNDMLLSMERISEKVREERNNGLPLFFDKV